MANNPSTKNAHEKLIARLLDNLPIGYTDQEVNKPNYPFTTPNDKKWMRATPIEQAIDNTQAGQNPWQRKSGVFVVDIFYPVPNETYGAFDNIEDAEAVQAAFQNVEFDGVRTQEAQIETVGIDGAWYMTQISINYFYEGYQNG